MLQHHLRHCWFLCVIMCWEERTVITEEQQEALKSASTRKCWLTSDPSRATGLAPVVIDSMMLFLQIHVSIFIVVKSCNVKLETRQETAPWSDLNDVVFISVFQNWIETIKGLKTASTLPKTNFTHVIFQLQSLLQGSSAKQGWEKISYSCHVDAVSIFGQTHSYIRADIRAAQVLCDHE